MKFAIYFPETSPSTPMPVETPVGRVHFRNAPLFTQYIPSLAAQGAVFESAKEFNIIARQVIASGLRAMNPPKVAILLDDGEDIPVSLKEHTEAKATIEAMRAGLADLSLTHAIYRRLANVRTPSGKLRISELAEAVGRDIPTVKTILQNNPDFALAQNGWAYLSANENSIDPTAVAASDSDQSASTDAKPA